MLKISKKPIGMGRERLCFVHPEDPRLAIKVSKDGKSPQTEREIRFYRRLEARGGVYCKHIPDFHGTCETNRGKGIVVELIRNYDGEISRPMNWYLAQRYPLEEFVPFLDEVEQAFLEHLLIFNHDLTIANLLVRKTSASKFHLVAIDGLGDTVAIDWLDRLPCLVRRKIRRRWKRFIERLYRSREVQLQREALSQEAQSER
jgi:hypothetical protein